MTEKPKRKSIIIVGIILPFLVAALADLLISEDFLLRELRDLVELLGLAVWPSSIMFVFMGVKKFYRPDFIPYLIVSDIINIFLYISISKGISKSKNCNKSIDKFLTIAFSYGLGVIVCGVLGTFVAVAAIPRF